MSDNKIKIKTLLRPTSIFGKKRALLPYIENKFKVKISYHNGEITIFNGSSKNIQTAADMMHSLIEHIQMGGNDIQKFVDDYIKTIDNPQIINLKTNGHKDYYESIDENIVTFVVGPAGTGKTYIAVAKAIELLQKREIKKIILVRPIIEAGEKLGYLPGNIKDKVDPYMRPIYDALMDFVSVDKINKYIEKGVIEITPLAFMRGRTFKNTFIILDEAQNITVHQMKMFLTRLGKNCKVVVNGDLSQTDLPPNIKSGLFIATKIFKNIEGINIVYLKNEDIMRSPLVEKIIAAFEKVKDSKLNY